MIRAFFRAQCAADMFIESIINFSLSSWEANELVSYIYRFLLSLPLASLSCPVQTLLNPHGFLPASTLSDLTVPHMSDSSISGSFSSDTVMFNHIPVSMG